jgi:hypothetical protein
MKNVLTLASASKSSRSLPDKSASAMASGSGSSTPISCSRMKVARARRLLKRHHRVPEPFGDPRRAILALPSDHVAAGEFAGLFSEFVEANLLVDPVQIDGIIRAHRAPREKERGEWL